MSRPHDAPDCRCDACCAFDAFEPKMTKAIKGFEVSSDWYNALAGDLTGNLPDPSLTAVASARVRKAALEEAWRICVGVSHRYEERAVSHPEEADLDAAASVAAQLCADRIRELIEQSK